MWWKIRTRVSAFVTSLTSGSLVLEAAPDSMSLRRCLLVSGFRRILLMHFIALVAHMLGERRRRYKGDSTGGTDVSHCRRGC